MFQSIRATLEHYARTFMWGITRPFAGDKLPGHVQDLCREIYNAGSEEITFVSIHPWRNRMYFHGLGPKYWNVIKIRAGEWGYLPHGWYSFHCPSGNQEYPCISNFGGNMFNGNKLPSRPEVKKINSFVPGVKSGR